MRNVTLFLALTALPIAGIAKNPAPVAVTNAERETGFASLGECQKALERTRNIGGGAAAGPSAPAGSLFNRTRGNVSRCEIVRGEALVVVYPRGHAGAK